MTTAKIETIVAEMVISAPSPLAPGVLYISERFNTALHLCCCGCGAEVVTPLNPAGWSYQLRNGRVSLWPSVGNWSLRCRSHYFIADGRVKWATQMTEAQIRRVKRRDASDMQTMVYERNMEKEGVSELPRISWITRVLKWLWP